MPFSRQKGNVIVRLEFELDFYDVTVQRVTHYAAEIPTTPTDTIDPAVCTSSEFVLCAYVETILHQ